MSILTDRTLLVLIGTLFLAIIIIIIANGSANNQPNYFGVDCSVKVNVVDVNGNIIGYQTKINEMEGIFNSTSHNQIQGLTYGTFDNGSLTNHDTYNYPIKPGDYMIFGGSTDQGFLVEDMNNAQFNNGNAGNWTIITYDDLLKKLNRSDNTVSLNLTITVSNSTGKMI